MSNNFYEDKSHQTSIFVKHEGGVFNFIDLTVPIAIWTSGDLLHDLLETLKIKNLMRVIWICGLFITLMACERQVKLPDDADDKTIIKVGDIIQQVQLTGLDSTTYTIGQDATKTTILYFFAPWCDYCKITTPKVQALKDELGDSVQVLAIAREEGIESLKAWQQTVDYTLPLIPDADRSFFAQFAEAYIPRFFVMDKTGEIIFTQLGGEEEIFEQIKEHLEGKGL